MDIHGFTQSGSIDATIDGVRLSIPNDPGNRHRQMIAAWEDQGNVIPPYVPAPADIAVEIKAEARRRILLIMTEDQQRNTLAAGQAAMMEHGPDPATWPQELQDRHAAAMVAWAEIERLRARSNAIEAMDPAPADISDDALWAASETP